MEGLLNEILFYGGIVVIVVTVIVAILLFFFFKIRKMKLDAKLNAEYGKENS